MKIGIPKRIGKQLLELYLRRGDDIYINLLTSANRDGPFDQRKATAAVVGDLGTHCFHLSEFAIGANRHCRHRQGEGCQ